MALPAQLLRELLTALRSDAIRRGPTDQRRAARVGVRKPIQATFLPQGEAPCTPPCWVRNVSATGIGLLCRRSLPSGTEFILPFKRTDAAPLRILYRITHTARVADDLFAIGGRLVSVVDDPARANVRAAS
jgi:hypothetical protein